MLQHVEDNTEAFHFGNPMDESNFKIQTELAIKK